jgi:drug/metabolite transporter (DMT)-like permease
LWQKLYIKLAQNSPVVASIFAVILLDEPFTIYYAAGLTLILVAVGMMMKPKIK